MKSMNRATLNSSWRKKQKKSILSKPLLYFKSFSLDIKEVPWTAQKERNLRFSLMLLDFHGVHFGVTSSRQIRFV